jgi:transposase
VDVDPKHTSQICWECGFMHPGNRHTQADFQCLFWGHQDNADHNAAVNRLARNEPPDANLSLVTLCVVEGISALQGRRLQAPFFLIQQGNNGSSEK